MTWLLHLPWIAIIVAVSCIVVWTREWRKGNK